MHTRRLPKLLAAALLAAAAPPTAADGPFFADGIKIGEVDHRSAIVWARLTAARERNPAGTPFAPDDDRLPEGKTLADMRDSVPGAPGEVRIRFQPADAGPAMPARTTGWVAVDPDADFTVQVPLGSLRPATCYRLAVEARPPGADEPTCTLDGGFSTAPDPGASAPVTFAVVTCHEFPRRDDPELGHQIYPAMSRVLDPAFLVHTGDIEYYDKPGPFAKSAELARYKWNRLFSLGHQRDFYRNHAAFFMKDDHDTLKDDCWPGQHYGELSWDQGLAIFREQVPLRGRSYRSVRWGRDLQLWLVEGRDFRSPNRMPDGPAKSIWGAEQKRWLFEGMRASDATFRILASPTPIVGPDRPTKNDNHSNRGFRHEGDEVRRFLGSLPNTFVVCGDRHWQYASVDAATGLREFSCGAGSDSHAGGFSEADRAPEHRFLCIRGGFLGVTVGREGDLPVITFRHHAVDGSVRHSERFEAAPR